MGTKYNGNMISFPKFVEKIQNILPYIPDDKDI